VIGYFDGSMEIMDRELRSQNKQQVVNDIITQCCFSHSHGMILVTSLDGCVTMVTPDLKPLLTITKFYCDEAPAFCAWGGSDSKIALGGQEAEVYIPTVQLWDLNNVHCFTEFGEDEDVGPLGGLDISPDERWICASYALQLQFLDCRTGTIVRSIDQDIFSHPCRISPDGSRVAIAGEIEQWTLFDSQGREVYRINGSSNNDLTYDGVLV